MGLSVNCARCHDHKFDPITQLDYYRTIAMFFGYVDYEHPLAPPEKVEEHEKIKKEVEEQVRPLRRQIALIEAPYRKAAFAKKLAKFPEEIQIAVQTPDNEDSRSETAGSPDCLARSGPGRRRQSAHQLSEPDPGERRGPAVRRKLVEQIEEIRKRLPPPLPVAEGVRDGDYRLAPDGPGDEPLPGKGDRFNYGVDCCFLPQSGRPFVVPPVYFGANGVDVAEDQRAFVVEPGYLQVLVHGAPPPVARAPANGNISSGRRRALAEWIASPENPLTARVMVNRVWSWHFGRGIVPTPGNFGRMGMPSSHPELLDWLATEFVRQGWSIKQMHRLIMSSETYQMVSSFSQATNLRKIRKT